MRGLFFDKHSSTANNFCISGCHGRSRQRRIALAVLCEVHQLTWEGSFVMCVGTADYTFTFHSTHQTGSYIYFGNALLYNRAVDPG